MDTTKQIVDAIGRARFEQMLKVGKKSVDRAMTKNLFTASWYRAIAEEIQEREDVDAALPAMSLFNFKVRSKS